MSLAGSMVFRTKSLICTCRSTGPSPYAKPVANIFIASLSTVQKKNLQPTVKDKEGASHDTYAAASSPAGGGAQRANCEAPERAGTDRRPGIHDYFLCFLDLG